MHHLGRGEKWSAYFKTTRIKAAITSAFALSLSVEGSATGLRCAFQQSKFAPKSSKTNLSGAGLMRSLGAWNETGCLHKGQYRAHLGRMGTLRRDLAAGGRI